MPGETDPQIHKSENDEGEGHAAPLGCAYARGRGLPPVGSGGCLGLGSAALPSPAADLSFVLGQELPESGGFGGPGPGLVIVAMGWFKGNSWAILEPGERDGG